MTRTEKIWICLFLFPVFSFSFPKNGFPLPSSIPPETHINANSSCEKKPAAFSDPSTGTNKSTPWPDNVGQMAFLGYQYLQTGRLNNAIRAFAKKEKFVREQKSLEEQFLFFLSYCELFLFSGDIKAARTHLHISKKIAEELEKPYSRALIANTEGNILVVSGKMVEAMQHYRKSLSIINQDRVFCAGKEMEFRARVMINLARVLVSLENFDLAFTIIKKTFHELLTAEDFHQRALLLLSIHQLSKTISTNLKKDRSLVDHISFQAATMAAKIAEHMKDIRLASLAYGELGEMYERNKRFDEALRLTRKALFLTESCNSPEIQYLWEWREGRLLNKSGYPYSALSRYKKAIRTLSPIRSALMIERGRQHTFKEKIRPVYTEYARLMLKLAEAESDPDKRQKLFMDTRDIIEQLKTTELEDFFKDECVTRAKNRMKNINQMPVGTLVIYPIVFPDSLAVLSSFSDRIIYRKVAVSSETLEKTAGRLRKYLQTPVSFRFKTNARKMYDWLIRPIEKELEKADIDTIIIAPDGPLRLIPIAALFDGKKYLIEKYSAVTIPALTITDAEPVLLKKANILLSGLSKSRGGFAPLPGVQKELTGLHRTTGGKILQDADFTLKNLRNEFRGNAFDIVHMATHGEFGNSPGKTFLLTYDGLLTMTKLEELISMGRFREKQVTLLMLSACKTAIGNERAALGLGGLAVKAGVRSAVATLWSVDDKATSFMVQEFYRQLTTQNQSMAKALQLSQKKMIQMPGFRHPAFWAPFLLIGNWM